MCAKLLIVHSACYNTYLISSTISDDVSSIKLFQYVDVLSYRIPKNEYGIFKFIIGKLASTAIPFGINNFPYDTFEIYGVLLTIPTNGKCT